MAGGNVVSVGECDHDDPFDGMIYKPYREQQPQYDDGVAARIDDGSILPIVVARACWYQ